MAAGREKDKTKLREKARRQEKEDLLFGNQFWTKVADFGVVKGNIGQGEGWLTGRQAGWRVGKWEATNLQR